MLTRGAPSFAFSHALFIALSSLLLSAICQISKNTQQNTIDQGPLLLFVIVQVIIIIRRKSNKCLGCVDRISSPKGGGEVSVCVCMGLADDLLSCRRSLACVEDSW